MTEASKESTAENGSGHEPKDELEHLVVIDDEDAILRLIEAALGKRYRVTTFDDPARALAQLQQESPPDLIICDVTMPGMSGFEVHEALRQVPALRSVPFVYLTALSDRSSYRKGMSQGADDYLTKPFSVAELREAVEVRLGRADALRQAAQDEMVITSLGGLGILVGGRRLQWEAQKAAELLLYLLAAGGSAPLRQVRTQLWHDSVPENTLRVLINRLRKAVADIAEVTVQDEVITLHYEGRYQWDAAGFEREAEAALESPESARLEAAIALYRGAFLPGIDSPWAEARRGQYEALYLQLLEAAVECAGTEAARKRAAERLEAFFDL